ncbi:MAG TPA: glycosyltransferase family 1 protein [Xanthobacteraceae bacterium]|nr:glycosyltransferase family 1 protein [Xanthobacteraceae bacterium]
MRLIYDLSSLVRWTGPAVGIARTDRELALWVRANLQDAVFAFFDPEAQAFREINHSWIDPLLSGRAGLDLFGAPSAQPERRRKTERIPKAVRPLALWVLQSRRELLGLLERLRLSLRDQTLKEGIERLQSRLISHKNRAHYFAADGQRRSFPPTSIALGARIAFSPGDVLFSAGFGWSHLNIHAISQLKNEHRLRYVFFCYDIIPLMYPEFYPTNDVDSFRTHFHAALPISDLTIFSAKKIEADVQRYCRAHDLALAATAVVPLGANTSAVSTASAALPSSLRKERYALFVSTIEPRKGHAMLYRVWRRLLEDGVPQSNDFKLVFVGRKGWMVDALFAQIAADTTAQGSLLIMSQVSDSLLSMLYENAAFCVYPSIYEGYGLPVVEAFSHGKAVISSSGGALAEVAGGFSPCLDPTDEDAWYATIKEWIANPDARGPYETAIRNRFQSVTWQESAAQMFRIVGAGG